MSPLIEDNDVKPVNLSLELERAVISHSLDEDGSIYVDEPGWFPFWIRVRKGNAHVILSTHTRFKCNLSKLQRLELCNENNMKYFLLTASMGDQRLHVDHTLLYRDGLTREMFVRVCRTFSHNIERALADLDPDDSFFMAPGEEEDESISGESE